jgi:hypothetical protein
MLNVVMLSVFMLNVVMLVVIMMNVVMLSVVMLNAVMLSVVILSVVILSVVILSVVATGYVFFLSYLCRFFKKAQPIQIGKEAGEWASWWARGEAGTGCAHRAGSLATRRLERQAGIKSNG